MAARSTGSGSSRTPTRTATTCRPINVGYRDQRFSASYSNYGKVKAIVRVEPDSAVLQQGRRDAVRHVDSRHADAERRHPDRDPEQDARRSATALNGAAAFDLRTRRDIATANVTYSATPNVDLGFTLRNTQKTGAYPWGGSFGISNAIATELPVPVDHRTTDLGTASNTRTTAAIARLGYDGSFFRNNVTTLVWDNPGAGHRLADAGPGAGSHGALAEHRHEHRERRRAG